MLFLIEQPGLHRERGPAGYRSPVPCHPPRRLLVAFFPTNARDTTAPTPCAAPARTDCPDTCALLTTVENGVAGARTGQPQHRPTLDGALCTKVSRHRAHLPPAAHLTPLRRRPQGAAAGLQPVGWTKALGTTSPPACRPSPRATRRPSCPTAYAGTTAVQGEGMAARFFHWLAPRTWTAPSAPPPAARGPVHTLGGKVGTSRRSSPNPSDLIWAATPSPATCTSWRLAQAKRDGARPAASIGADRNRRQVPRAHRPAPGTTPRWRWP